MQKHKVTNGGGVLAPSRRACPSATLGAGSTGRPGVETWRAASLRSVC
ncbi:MAG: hypothetical protein LBL94_02175 [Prevotellaceae bacterium]|nr:hypothetical protein [Prevotellaceae bacterium]